MKVRERRSKKRTIHCSSCGHDNCECSECGEAFLWAPEKGVDTAIVTDLLSLTSEGAYDAAALLSSDADHIPAVEWVQSRGGASIQHHHGFDLGEELLHTILLTLSWTR